MFKVADSLQGSVQFILEVCRLDSRFRGKRSLNRAKPDFGDTNLCSQAMLSESFVLYRSYQTSNGTFGYAEFNFNMTVQGFPRTARLELGGDMRPWTHATCT